MKKKSVLFSIILILIFMILIYIDLSVKFIKNKLNDMVAMQDNEEEELNNAIVKEVTYSFDELKEATNYAADLVGELGVDCDLIYVNQSINKVVVELKANNDYPQKWIELIVSNDIYSICYSDRSIYAVNE